TSYLRWDTVKNTPVADPINEPWPGGTKAQLATLGIRVKRVIEWAISRMPTDAETEVLRLGRGVPVVELTRRMFTAEDEVVEVALPIVRRGDTTRVEYEVVLED
ncbi:UTRA domain-containing protein, partial [Kitasatospora sp. NPDC058965]|uniref:UTRA domain-containing protein n=1 Tax=Kitasatospora sp. NPDC058965 TaxID=3346682 RepID=UPI003698950C